MFKTGSKFLLGLAAFGFIGAYWYAYGTGDHGGAHKKLGPVHMPDMAALLGPLTLGYKGHVGEHAGYAILIGLFATALFLGIVFSALRDAEPHHVAEVAGTEAVPEVPAPVSANYWPLVGAFSLASIAIGLAVGPPLVVIGGIGLACTVVEWAVSAWSDRATGDPEVNRAIRHRFLNPVEIPVGAVIGIGGLVFCISRVLLAVPKTPAYFIFGGVPLLVLGIGVLVAMVPKLSKSIIAAMLIVFALAILASGVAAGIHGAHKSEEKKGGQESLVVPAPTHLSIRAGR
jgi:hypothetical protein